MHHKYNKVLLKKINFYFILEFNIEKKSNKLIITVMIRWFTFPIHSGGPCLMSATMPRGRHGRRRYIENDVVAMHCIKNDKIFLAEPGKRSSFVGPLLSKRFWRGS